jgi:hypothetical protein
VYSNNNKNYFAVSAVNGISWTIHSGTALSVQQAFMIDSKTDDGLPLSGNVTAVYVNYDASPYAVIGAAGNNQVGASGTSATPYASTNCYDNNNVAGPQRYSIAKNAGALNCALSFQFQQ